MDVKSVDMKKRNTEVTSASRRNVFLRWMLAGPAALLLSVAVTAAMPIWFPKGAANIGHFIFPVVLFPAVWAAAFTYTVLERNLVRATLIVIGATALNAVVAWSSGGWT